MDKLDRIFALQKHLDTEIIEKRNLQNITPAEWVQKDVLAILSELAELLDEVNFKWWKNEKPIDTKALHEELVDVLHFFVSMCIHAGLDAEGLYAVYEEKNKENIDRQYGRSHKAGYAADGSGGARDGEGSV